MSKHETIYKRKNLGNPSHIINLGVPIQVHHLISQSKYAKLKESHMNMLNEAGYSIHNIDNLIGLPCTVAGGCQLEVQIHKGNHSKFGGEKSYHEIVEEELRKLFKKIDRNLKKPECDGKDTKAQMDAKIKKYEENRKKQLDTLKKEMNYISEEMLEKIIDFEVKLTAQHLYYEQGNIGCCGTTIGNASTGDISVETLREHAKERIFCTQSNRNGNNNDRHYPRAPLGNYILEQGK